MTDCGNRRIDGLARVGAMRSIWDRLEFKFPMVRAHAQDVWLARRDGRIRRLVESDARYSCLLASPVTGPRTDREWVLLAIAALSAIGREPCEGEWDRADGLWVGQAATHPAVVARHAECDRCAAGLRPCPMQGYPMAHV